MADGELSGEVRHLIARHVTTMEQVEVLLLLQRAPERALSPDEIRAELRLQPSAPAPATLAGLQDGGLVEREGAHPARYRYAPANDALRRAVELLATAYNERPVTLIRLIYERPNPVQSFADAFRIRGDDR